jgi:hypothetical protein
MKTANSLRLAYGPVKIQNRAPPKKSEVCTARDAQ